MKQRNMAQMKEQNKTPQKNKQNGDSLLYAEFKTLVIKMLRELAEYSRHIREEMKATLSETKKNPQGTNSEGKEVGI